MTKFLKNKNRLLIIFLMLLFESILMGMFIEIKMMKPYSINRFVFSSFGIFLLGSIIIGILKNGIKNHVIETIKLVFSLSLIIYVIITYHKFNIFAFSILELNLIFLLSNTIINKSKIFGNIISNLLYLLYNSNLCVYLFASSYIDMIKLTNLSSAGELSGNAYPYIIGIILVLIFSFLSTKKSKILYKNQFIIFVVGLIVIITSTKVFDNSNLYLKNASMGNYVELIKENSKYTKIKKMKKKTKLEKNEFYKKDINNYYDKDEQLIEKPNVIMIFTEGLSNHIIYDKRNIMPNLKEFSTKSLNFENYYNHTAATYRGIMGQLFSGFQIENDDTNYLISIEDILKNNGYNTSFINVDPKNKEFSNYLKKLHFNEIHVPNAKIDAKGNYYSDKIAYEELYKYANKLNKKEEPFFLSIYTLNTHVSQDSVYIKFKNGKSNVLNRFYELDAQFGDFIKKFNKSKLSENTIIVFTSDHASYLDRDYKNTFPNNKRENIFCDKVPLFIYYKGITPKTINVNGKTSIDLAPTILDYIDISDENYFLGESLFGGKVNKYDHLYFYGTYFEKIKNNKITKLSSDDDKLETSIYYYFNISTKNNNNSKNNKDKKGV